MASKSYQVIICEHLQTRFHWWYSLYTSLLEVAAAYEKNQPFSATPHEDAALLDNLNQDVDWAYRMAQALAEELGRAESALNAPKPQPKPKPAPQPAPAPEPEPIDVSDIPFAAVDAQPAPEDDSKEADFTRGWNDYHAGVKWYEVELSRSRGWYAALDAEMAAQPVESPKVKPRKPYRCGWPMHHMPLWDDCPRPINASVVKLVDGIRLRVLGEVS